MKVRKILLTVQSRFPNDEFLFLILIGLLSINGLRVGMQLVIAAWLAVKFTGTAQGAGVLFVSSAVSALVFARLIGRAVGAARSKKRVVMLGQGGMTIAALLPALFTRINGIDHFAILLTVCALLSTLSMISGGGVDYFVRRLSPGTGLQKGIATLMSLSQISMMLGTAVAGGALLFLDFGGLFMLLAGLSGGALLLSAWRLTDEPSRQRGAESSQSSLCPGVASCPLPSASLRLTMLCMAVAFAVGQFTNVLLPGLVQLQRGGSSLGYSLIEIAWSSGSLLASSVLAVRHARASGTIRTDLVILGFLSALLALVPLATKMAALVGVHLLLGIGFAVVRVRGETRFLTNCPKETLGHLRATSNMLMQAAALLAFSLPIVAADLSLPTLYYCSAALIGAGMLILTAMVVRRGL